MSFPVNGNRNARGVQKTVQDLSILRIHGIVGKTICTASRDGQTVYERLEKAFEAEQPVALSFQNVSIMTPAFLNVAIGQLYGKYAEGKIDGLLSFRDITDNDLELVHIVIASTKRYFQDPVRYRKIFREELSG